MKTRNVVTASMLVVFAASCSWANGAEASYKSRQTNEVPFSRTVFIAQAGTASGGAPNSTAAPATTPNSAAAPDSSAASIPPPASEATAEPPNLQLKHFLEEQQIAHDRVLIDRFLFGVAIMFLIISFLLMMSLPPRQREQEG